MGALIKGGCSISKDSRLSPEQRVIQARAAAYQSWANTSDWQERTSPARQGFMARFIRQVDPDGLLRAEERQRRAQAAMHSYMCQLALKSSRSRSRSTPAAEAA